MIDRAGYLLALVDQLTITEPWTGWSDGADGFPDSCAFCGSVVVHYDGRFTDSLRAHIHEPGCIWIEAMDYLGRPHPKHVTRTAQ